MDFTNLATVEFVGAIQAQRDYERKQRKWLYLWQDLRRAADARARSAPQKATEVTKAA